MFNPGTDYTVRPEIVQVEDFHKYADDITFDHNGKVYFQLEGTEL